MNNTRAKHVDLKSKKSTGARLSAPVLEVHIRGLGLLVLTKE